MVDMQSNDVFGAHFSIATKLARDRVSSFVENVF